jgi:hypothetical protein
MKALGMVLIIVGVVALAYGGFSWTQKEKVVDVGPIELTADKTRSVALPPLAGGLMLVAGLVLVMKK